MLSEIVGPEGKVVAVDPDVERIKIAKEMNARPNIEYLVGHDQSFPGVGYKFIFSNQVIHWIKHKETLFKRLYDKLAAGGQFAFVTSNGTPTYPPTTKRALSSLISPDFEDYLFQQKLAYQSAAEYEKLAESVGFKVTLVDSLVSKLEWTSVDDFLNFWAAVSHGLIAIASVDHKALQDFKEYHEKDLIAEKVHFKLLYIVPTKM